MASGDDVTDDPAPPPTCGNDGDTGADKAPAPEAVASRQRWRWHRILLVVIALPALGALYFYAFCNWSFHSEDWARERINVAIADGLDYLDGTGAFGKSVEEGGESPPHHYFLELVLDRHPHRGLRSQIARAKELNRTNWEWRTYFGMPGWPRSELTSLDHTRIQYAVNHSENNYYAEWLLHGLYPDWTELRPEEEQRLLNDTTLLRHSYHMTHALLAYLWMKRVDPAVAAQRGVDQLIDEVNERLYRAQMWDPCTSDIYNERVAFWLYMDDPPPIKRRWIERIILSQNKDGGWTFEKSIGRSLGQLVGYDPGTGKSDPHATFLALYALSEYEALQAQLGR